MKDVAKHLAVEALRLLQASGYLWDEWCHGFRRVRDVDKQSTDEYLASRPDVISSEELSDHGCIKPDATVGERHAATLGLSDGSGPVNARIEQ